MAQSAQTMVQSAQAYDAHQQQFTTELSLCANYPVVQIQQSINDMRAMINAQFWNLNAKMQHSKVDDATGALVVMRSLDQGPNPQVPVNQAIPNFPNTPDEITLMSGLQCRNILTSLDAPIPQGQQVRTRQLRTAVRKAIGLPAL